MPDARRIPAHLRTLSHAMDAKREIFMAQDAAELIVDDALRAQVRRALAGVRSDLEALDRLLRDRSE